MQENINIPDSHITANLTFRQLVLMNMQQLTNFPYIEKDFDALTDYELLCLVVKFLNDVIANQNEQNDSITNMYNAFLALQTYVNNTKDTLEEAFNNLDDYVRNYFNNLDVQEEINNKLDDMTEDGTLTTLIGNYVDPIYQAYETEINEDISNFKTSVNNSLDDMNEDITTFKSSVNISLNNMDNRITNGLENISTGTPLIVSSTSSMTDTSRIYVNTTDGKWYYYDGDSWEIGGTYQATAIADGSVNYESFSNELKNDIDARTYKTEELNYNDYTVNLSDYGNWVNKNVDGTTGEITTNNSAVLTNEKLIYIPNHARILIEVLNSFFTSANYYDIYMYDEKKNFIGTCNYFSRITPTDLPCSYVRLRIVKSGIVAGDISNFRMTISQSYSKNIKYTNTNTNLVNLETIYKNKYIDGSANMALKDSTTYSTTDFIPVVDGDYKTKSNIRMYALYNKDKEYITNSYTQNITPNDTITINDASYIRYTYYNADTEIMFYKSDEELPYEQFKKKLEYSASLSDTMIDEVQELIGTVNGNNILTGKKLVTCGDSFTQYTNATFDSGTYAGENKVWPFLIALRNNMIVHNMAVSGGTMATGDFVVSNKFSAGLYQQIDNDADYIILKYGINDNNENVPIGTINDNSTDTFYGAWNTVMSYIIANHPVAKIGIIVTNGLVINENQPNNSNYANAIINIAKKFGIPTLNEWNDPNVPLLIRTGRTDVDQSIRDLRATTFRVNQYNTHENYICQEYESTIIEDFLRRL